jgi:chloramphenicol-sensitive protein RarD
MQSGVVFAFLAYLIWGFFPLYFHQVDQVPALEVVMHRILWSMLCIALLLGVRRHWAWLFRLNRKIIATFAASALLIGINWLVYIWAIQQHQVVNASLGYFIQPLLNVVLGTLLLQERPRQLQWLAVGLAALGVLWLTWQAGHFPWLGLTLAFSFGLYGLIRKTAALGALEGLALETALLTPLAVVFLLWSAHQGQAAWPEADAELWGWLLAAGPITAIPLLLYAAGARRITLTTLGILQYMVPSMQFFLGIYYFEEPLELLQLIGFGFIWVALVIFMLEGLWKQRQNSRPLPN